jgi:hypothetical protein
VRGALTPLLGAVALAVVAWALVVPPFQVPDEGGHFGYVQSLAEEGERPREAPPGAPRGSTEQRVAAQVARSARVAGNFYAKPPWGEDAERLWEEEAAPRLEGERRRDSRGGNQGGHPPGYYAYEALPYWIASGGDAFDRLYLMRLWSGLLALVTVAGAWLLIGELAGRDRLLQLAGAACVGLQPMVVFVSAGVNPDAALLALTSLGLWLGVRVLRRGPTRATVAGLVAVTAAAGFVKAAGLALVIPALFALVVAARRRGARVRLGLGLAGTAAGAVAVVATSALGRDLGERTPVDAGLTELRAFASYLWQFYLPRVSFQRPVEGLGQDPLWDVWLKGSWAGFGSVGFPDAGYVIAAVVTVAVLLAACAALVRRAAAPGAAPLAFLGLFVAGLVLGAHWVEFWSLERGEGVTAQGRYLLPLMPVAGAAVAFGLCLLRGRGRAIGAAAVLAGMVALQLFALGVVAGRFYA